jgi:hypothetical protein
VACVGAGDGRGGAGHRRCGGGPSSWPARRAWHSVACVEPVEGQSGEQVPASAKPCGVHTFAASTTTDNDAEVVFLVL